MQGQILCSTVGQGCSIGSSSKWVCRMGFIAARHLWPSFPVGSVAGNYAQQLSGTADLLACSGEAIECAQ